MKRKNFPGRKKARREAAAARLKPKPCCDVDHSTLKWRRNIKKGRIASICKEIADKAEKMGLR